MRAIIAGSRDGITLKDIYNAVKSSGFELEISTVVSGTARGADRLGEQWANVHKIPVNSFPAKWEKPDGTLDRSAGYKRNELMAQNADALIAVWDGHSNGTKHMIDLAKKYNLLVHVHYVEKVQ